MSIGTKPVNSWNFLSWYTATGVTTSNLGDLAPTRYGLYKDIVFDLPFKEGDSFAFYINFDSAISTSGFSNWKLALLDCDYALLISEIGTLSQDTITGTSSYNVYSSFTWPVVPGRGSYYLIIWDSSDNSVKYISNRLRKLTATTANKDTVTAVFRNSANVFNYRYSSVTDYYNRFRLPVWIQQPTNISESIGYDLNDGTYLRVREIVKETERFVTGLGDRYFHQGFFAMIKHHDYLQINGIRYQQASGEAYEPAFEENGYPLARGSVRLTLLDKAKSFTVQ